MGRPLDAEQEPVGMTCSDASVTFEVHDKENN